MEHYSNHVETLNKRLDDLLSDQDYDGIVFHSGELHYYFSDDSYAPFKTNPHFAHWLPLAGPGHMVVAKPNEKPKVIARISEDYWYEPVTFDDPFWQSEFQYKQTSNADESKAELGNVSRLAFVGEASLFAKEAGFSDDSINPSTIVNRLDWNRSDKTSYEIDRIIRASELAAAAHIAARRCFENGGTELDIHHAYIQAIDAIDAELPYESIVALDEKGAFLHYVNKRTEGSGKVLLLDSGATHLGYASDITRTWTMPEADPLFEKMRQDFDRLELELCELVRPGLSFLDLHITAHKKIGKLLCDSGILKVSADDAFERGLTRPFFPHGLGHYLGIQVHDVAGRQENKDGGTIMPPDIYPFLRTTRTLSPTQVITIEPGLYFIEMLLRPFRSGDSKSAFDWDLIDRLKGHGGIRVEDDVVVTENGAENITRQIHPN